MGTPMEPAKIRNRAPFACRAVGAAVLFLGEGFTWVNACGLVVLLAGVVLFNLQKLHKVKQGQIRGVLLEEPGSRGSKGSETGEEEASHQAWPGRVYPVQKAGWQIGTL